MDFNIIGRKSEIELLQRQYQVNQSSFIAVYGRRRVGKTFLIRSVFEDKMLFTIKNKKHKSNKDQTGGIGMVNVKRRLDLTYPDKYKLTVENREDDYYSELYLNL